MNKTPLKVIIAGGQGAIGTSIINGLLRCTTASFSITGLTRQTPVPSSTTTPLHTLTWTHTDYENLAQLVTIFTGADAVVSAIHQTHALKLDELLLDAAVQARVPRFFPCDYDCDRSHAHVGDTAGDVYAPHFEFMEKLGRVAREGRISWTVVMPSEFLDGDALPWLGFDLDRKEVTLYDGGEHQATGCTPEFFGDCFAVVVTDAETRNRRVAVAEVAYTGLEMVRVLEVVMGKEWKVVDDVSSRESMRRADEALKAEDRRKAYLTHVLRLNYDGVGPANLVGGLKFMEGQVRRRSLREIVENIVKTHLSRCTDKGPE